MVSLIRAFIAIVQTLFMRDLRGRLVFPRLAYTTSAQAVDRNLRRCVRFMIIRPGKRVGEFFIALEDHRGVAEILVAATAALTEVIRATALFLLALGFFLLAIVRL